MEKNFFEYIIIGAGISGLTIANYIKNNYIILEKENEVGGYCRTIKKGDFIWDYAGHFFHFKTDEFKKIFMDDVDKNDIIYKEKCTKILYKDKLIDYPFQTNIHQLDKQDFIDCLYDLFNKEEKDNYNNFLEMLYGKFGKSITEKFLKPYNEKLYACDLQKLDKDAMGRFFPYADIKQIINNMKNNEDASYNNKFMYPKNGAGSFINILYNQLDKENVKLNTTIKNIDIENKTITTDSGKQYSYKYLINTAPLNQFLELCEDCKNKDLINNLSYNKVLVFNLGFNKKSKFVNEHWIYIPDKEDNYYRIGFYDNILDTNKLSMYIEIGFDKNANINEQEQLKLTLENLKKNKIIDEDMKLEEYVSIIMDPAYVHINTETDKKISELKERLKDNNIYTIGRYGAWTYCSMEDCMVEAKKLASTIIKKQ